MPRVKFSGKALKQAQRKLIDRTEPKIAAAFLSDIQSLCDDALMNSLAHEIARGNMDDIEAVLGIDEAAFDNYRAAMAEAFRQGGNLAVEHLPALRTVDG
jgi:hypothetical protein